MLDPAANLKLEQQFGPIPLVCTLIVLAENLLRGSHGEGLSHLYLKRCRIRFRTQPRLLLLEYAQDESVDNNPAVLPEELEEPLQLAERYDLRKERRYPIDAK